MHLLLVDYSENELKVNRDMFEACNHQVDTASSVHIAVAKIKMTAYHAIVTEINFPDDSGMWLLKRMASIRPDTPVFILTDGISLTRAIKALKLHAVDVIQKPLDFKKLMSIQEQIENFDLKDSGNGSPNSNLKDRLEELRKSVELIGREFNLRDTEVLDLLKQSDLNLPVHTPQ